MTKDETILTDLRIKKEDLDACPSLLSIKVGANQ